MNIRMLDFYNSYLAQSGMDERSQAINEAKQDLLDYACTNPDYHEDTLRNGMPQPLILTRGGEKNSYNVICLPDHQLFAGDIIDAFGQKFIVMEARADMTTHKTGIMRQCNHLFRFQNFKDPTVIERWGYIDISGYSSAFNSDTQIQASEEQLAIYLPYDEDTAKIYVDKRLASHVGYDPNGNKMLFAFKVTGTNPISESYNCCDHLLMLKATRTLYSKEGDNIELQICDYVEPGKPDTPDVNPDKTPCEIVGRGTIRIGTSRLYSPKFGDDDKDLTPVWDVFVDGGVASTIDGRQLRITVDNDDSLIGSAIQITLCDEDGAFAPATMDVEVIGFG